MNSNIFSLHCGNLSVLSTTLASLPPLTRSFLEINAALKRLGYPASPSTTPGECASALIHLLPEAQISIQYVVDEYEKNIYYRKTYLADTDIMAIRAGAQIPRKSFYFKIKLFSRQIKVWLSSLAFRKKIKNGSKMI